MALEILHHKRCKSQGKKGEVALKIIPVKHMTE